MSMAWLHFFLCCFGLLMVFRPSMLASSFLLLGLLATVDACSLSLCSVWLLIGFGISSASIGSGQAS